MAKGKKSEKSNITANVNVALAVSASSVCEFSTQNNTTAFSKTGNASRNLFLKEQFLSALESEVDTKTHANRSQSEQHSKRVVNALFDEAKKQNEIDSILDQIRTDEQIRKDQKKAAQDLEKELTKALAEKEKEKILNSDLEDQINAQHFTATQNAAVNPMYGSNQQATAFNRPEDFYKNPNDTYAQTQYDLESSRKIADLDEENRKLYNSPLARDDLPKSAIDDVMDKVKNVYKRN
jgi:uncharacterized protein (UPF0147 family)